MISSAGRVAMTAITGLLGSIPHPGSQNGFWRKDDDQRVDQED